MKHYLQRRKDNDELSLFDAFDDFFRPAFFDEVNDLKTNIKDTGNGYDLAVEVPGYKKDEIKVSLENGYLTVSCARNGSDESKGDGRWLRKEISESCSRSYYVGDDVTQDKIKAKYENGILNLSVPKSEPKQIKSNFIDIE